ncbi:MAG TPA: VTT domain-containing protein [Thermoanaerobaculia bacterium]|nr:VTT domain-containing protein [Thermoanaerobaculia bacterium]
MSLLARLPRRALIRFGAFVLLILVTAAVFRFSPLAQYLDKDHMVALLSRLQQAWWAPIFLVLLYILLTPLGLPATPLLVGGALVFGRALGSFYNSLGLCLGAVASYFLAKNLGGELIRHLGGVRLRKVERFLSRRGFFNLVAARFMPLPFPAVNFAMALAGIRLVPFLASTALGLIPATVLWSHFYASIFEAAAGERAALIRRLGTILFLLGFITLLPNLVQRRTRRRRLKRLREERLRRAALRIPSGG